MRKAQLSTLYPLQGKLTNTKTITKQHQWIASSTPQLQPVQGLWQEIKRSVTSVVEIELWAHRIVGGTHIEFWEFWSYGVEDTQLEIWSTDNIPTNHLPKLNTQQRSPHQCVYKTCAIIIFHMAWIVENNRSNASNFHPQLVFCTESCDITLVATNGFLIDILLCKTKLTCDLKSKRSVTSVVEIGLPHRWFEASNKRSRTTQHGCVTNDNNGMSASLKVVCATVCAKMAQSITRKQ